MRLLSLPYLEGFPEQAAGPQAGDDAVDALRGDADSFSQKEPVQLLAPTAGVLLAELQDPLLDAWRSFLEGWRTDIPGPAAAILEAGRTALPVAPNPAANGVWTAAKVAGRKTCVAAVLFVPVHHYQSALGFRAGLCREPGQARCSRQRRLECSHRDASVSSSH